MAATEAHALTVKLSTSVKALFRALARGVPPRTGTIELRQHGGAGYSGGASVPADDCPLPDAVLGILERSASPWGAGLAVRHVGGGLFGLAALAVHREFPRTYYNPADPESPHGKRWCFPEADIAGWEASLEDWPLPPTLVLRALPAVWALWALGDPMLARSAEDQAAALELLRALARAFGAELPGVLFDVEVPLPGTRCRNQDPRVVTCVRLDEARIYAASAIEAATRRS